MEMKKLDFAETLKDSIAIGVKNAPSVVVAVALWLVTIWIPYINIGTTIAISLLPVELAKGSVINPLGIFDSKYRRYMGEYLITAGLMVIPIYIAFVFMIVPGIVLSLSWALSFYFLLGKGKNPMQAIKASNDATYGSKWTMFLVTLVFGIMVGIVFGILYAICLAINVGFITFLVMFVLPQILLVGSGVVDKTSFSVPAVSVGERKTASGKVVINGMVRGHINGTVRGMLRATVDGDVDLNVISGSAGGEEAEQDEQ